MKKKDHETFVKELYIINPGIEVTGTYINCSTKIDVRGIKCNHNWSATPNALLRGSGCPVCEKNQKKSQDEFVQELKDFNPYIEVLGIYENAHKPIKVKCAICGSEWMCKPMRLLHGAQCQTCIKPHTSFMEQFILIAFQNTIGKNKVQSRNTDFIGLELDIYIPDYKLAIEPGTWLYHKDKVYTIDLQKRKKCNERGVRLITIYDTYPNAVKPPYETDCYVFEGFLNEYGYQRIIELTKSLMDSLEINHSDLDWDEIANSAYANCHYNAHQTFIDKLATVAPDIEVIEDYKGTNTPILVRNRNCGHPAWNARPYTLLKGIGCPICGRSAAAQSKTRTHQEFIDEFQAVNPSIKVIGEYTKVTERIEVMCKECGLIWNPLAYSLISGKGCPHCSAQNAAKKRNNRLAVKTTEQYIQELTSVNPTIRVSGKYINNKTKIAVECLICGHQWDVVPASLLNGHGCPKCARKKRSQSK